MRSKKRKLKNKLSRVTEALTRYTNPSEASTMAFIRLAGVVGVVRSTLMTTNKQIYQVN